MTRADGPLAGKAVPGIVNAADREHPEVVMLPEYSPTGGRSGWLPASSSPTLAETLTLRRREPGEQPEIDCNFLAGDGDARRILEGVKLARKIGGNPALAQFELETMPGAAVEDDQLADVIASNLGSQATQPPRRR